MSEPQTTNGNLKTLVLLIVLAVQLFILLVFVAAPMLERLGQMRSGWRDTFVPEPTGELLDTPVPQFNEQMSAAELDAFLNAAPLEIDARDRN